MSVEQQIQKAGWELEIWPSLGFRAVMGGFCTPWRESEDETLADVKAYQIKPNLEPREKRAEVRQSADPKYAVPPYVKEGEQN